MKILETDRDPANEILAALTSESHGPDPEVEQTVRGIIADVRKHGDASILELGRKFDSPDLGAIRAEPARLLGDGATRRADPHLDSQPAPLRGGLQPPSP